ncbi:hypothetical protein [Peptostreptococcus porci]|uniref:hypothetical protein n=1 Tax=Peptostreptococcus porci TaxID=2652282 RepID=UPI002A920686|nr:hypothetical protein [Peptostreptococcus porci]MDY5437127.1 hypothetical protein [Peptostreptococcus porci]
MNKLIMMDGSSISINTKLSLWDLKAAQNDGLISAGFVKDIISVGMGSLNTDMFDVEKINVDDIINLSYVCYKNGKSEYLEYDDFMKNISLDLAQLMDLYADVLIDGMESKNNKLANSFKYATPKQKNKSKKKSRR